MCYILFVFKMNIVKRVFWNFWHLESVNEFKKIAAKTNFIHLANVGNKRYFYPATFPMLSHVV